MGDATHQGHPPTSSCLHRPPSSFKCSRSRGSKQGAHTATSSWHWRLPQFRPSVSCSGQTRTTSSFSGSSAAATPLSLGNSGCHMGQINLLVQTRRIWTQCLHPHPSNNPQNIKTYRHLSNLLSEVRNKNWKAHHKPGEGSGLQRKAHVYRSARTGTRTRSDTLLTRVPLFSNCCLAWEAHKGLSDH